MLKEIRAHLTDLTTEHIQLNWFNELDHVFYINIIAYCQQNRYVRLAIYTDVFTLKTIHKFVKVDYKLSKENLLDINFLIKCQWESIISNFHKFCLADKDLQNSVSYIKCQQNLLPTEINARNCVWELCKMSLIVWVIYNSAWTMLIFIVAMIIFKQIPSNKRSLISF